jgi:hypoxanthine phosphoribosyltransferase
VSWPEIEQIVDSIQVNESIDEVVGILSGGAFISFYVAQKNGIPKISYVCSSYWSASSPISNISKIVDHLLNRPVVVSNVEFPDNLNVENKVVLLVDDTICTSVTANSVADKLYKMKAKKVLRYALFCNSSAKADYIGVTSGAPIIWPWGWEAD